MASKEKCEALFAEMDTDGSGALSQEELRAKLGERGYTPDNLDRMFESSDTSGDNKLSLDEFLDLMGHSDPATHKAAACRRVFHDFDKDGSGEITVEDLKKVYAEMNLDLPEDMLQRTIDRADKDGNGTLDCEEFLKSAFPGAS